MTDDSVPADAADDDTPAESTAERSGDTPTDREVACFEAGVKFGSLYHQFAGTPLSPDSAEALARAMERSIENQPYCEEVVVETREEELAAALADGPADYTEWTGRFAEVRMRIEYGGVTVRTEMAIDDGYPLMSVESVEE
ncbi:MAG: dihydroneopterin aldolase family protein [Haloglomus sp.]